jgi:hypothetical protein
MVSFCEYDNEPSVSIGMPCIMETDTYCSVSYFMFSKCTTVSYKPKLMSMHNNTTWSKSAIPSTRSAPSVADLQNTAQLLVSATY